MDLSSLQTKDGLFSLAEFSDEVRFIDKLGLDPTDKEGKKIISDIINLQMKVFSGSQSKSFAGASGFILDPDLSFRIYSDLNLQTGLALNLNRLEIEHNPLALPKLIGDWGVREIANNYAFASLTLFYHPQEAEALRKRQFLAEIYDYCKHEEIGLVLTLVIFSFEDKKFNWTEFQKNHLTAITQLRSLADLLVLQYPGDSFSCATITAELDIPWVISDRGMEYETYKENLRDSLENGAKGFLVGESLWKEIETMRKADHSPDVDSILKFVKTTSQDRISELSRIVFDYADI